MRFPGVKSVKTFSRWLRARVLGGALILGYHRISAGEDDCSQVRVSPENFSGHMKALREYAYPIGLPELVQSLSQNILPPKAVAVTFDDGYVDTLHIAKPILERFDIPATVFICTGYLGREFWWDELERLVLATQADPRSLFLQTGSTQFRWNPSRETHEFGRPEVYRQFHEALYRFLLPLDIEDQNHAMEAIRRWSEVTSPANSSRRALNEAELLRLEEGGLIELGAHTSHHPALTALTLERQREEILSSKRVLEALLGKQIAGFSYPNGRAAVDTRRLVESLGFAYACSSIPDVVRPGGDLYALSRFWQQDVDEKRFVAGLQRWM